MANVTTDTRFFQDHTTTNNKNKNDNVNEANRQEIQAAIAKAVELRALHAALMQGNSPSNLRRFPSSSSPATSLPAPQFSSHDYPVFTPVSTAFSPIYFIIYIYICIYTFFCCSSLVGFSSTSRAL